MGNPLTKSGDVFFGRDDVFNSIREDLAGKSGHAMVLNGQRRIGKTSILYQLHSHLPSEYICILLDLQRFKIESLDGFLGEVALCIHQELESYQIHLKPIDFSIFKNNSLNAFEKLFLNEVFEAIGERRIILMVDETIRLQQKVKSGILDDVVFGYIRHLTQEYEHITFLFTLSNSADEKEKNFNFMFLNARYMKISFLDPNSAKSLIVNPINGIYKISDGAINKIQQITSRHPYFIQLICNNLFARWQEQPKDKLTTKDVDAVIITSVDFCSPVLGHIWNESTSSEKAVLSALAILKTQNTHQHITSKDINEIWLNQNVRIPNGEMESAIEALALREIIFATDHLEFAVDILRNWISDQKHLEWVKEEIKESIQSWHEKDSYLILDKLRVQITDPAMDKIHSLFLIDALMHALPGTAFVDSKSVLQQADYKY